MDKLNCKCKSISPEIMQNIMNELPNDENIGRLAEFFKVFGDPTRLKILYFLSRQEFCVADLSQVVGMQQSAVSHQLKLLKLHRLVRFRKEGATVYYALDDMHIESIFAIARAHLQEQ